MLLGLAILPAAWLAGVGDLLGVGDVVSWIAGDDDPPVSEGEDPPPTASDPAAPTAPMASRGDLDLHLPTSRPVLVGFHEASTAQALDLRPVGRMVENENTTRFSPPPTDDTGHDYLVLSSRGRAHGATTAIDVLMRPGDPVRSPVDGTVTEVREYVLYGRHHDVRIEIAPDDDPGLRVVLIHVDEVEVEEGAHVRAGRSTLARTARPFPFSSQIDRYTEPDRWPHVHLEVKAADGDDAERP